MLRTSSSTTSTFLPVSVESLRRSPASASRCIVGEIAFRAMQEQRRLLQQPVERLRMPHHALPRQPPDLRFQRTSHLRLAAHHHRRCLRADLRLNLLHQLPSPQCLPAASRSRYRPDTGPSATARASPPDATDDDLDIGASQAIDPRGRSDCPRPVTSSSFFVRRCNEWSMVSKAVVQRILRDCLFQDRSSRPAPVRGAGSHRR